MNIGQETRDTGTKADLQLATTVLLTYPFAFVLPERMHTLRP